VLVMEAVPYSEFRDELLKRAGSLRQAEIATFCGVSQAAVSKWFAGISRPRRLVLSRLSALLNIDLTLLAGLAKYDPEEVAHLGQYHTTFEEDLVFSEKLYKQAQMARIRGNSDLALGMLDDLSEWLERKSRHVSSLVYSQVLSLRQAHILFEQQRLLKETLRTNDTWRSVQPIVARLQTMAAQAGNSEILGLADVVDGDLHYVLNQYSKSAQKLTSLLALNIVKEPKDKANLLRVLTLSLAYLGKRRDVEQLAPRLVELAENLTSSNPELVCQLYEGLGRAFGLLKLPESYDFLQKGWAIYNDNSAAKTGIYYPLGYGILTRSELAIMLSAQEPYQPLSVDRAHRTLLLAQQFRYQRLSELITKMLDGYS